jgi:ferric-dicitrate binding protein FerR (iron transport regulator)
MTHDESERASRAALEPLRRSPVGVSSPQDADEERRRLLPHLEDMVARVPGERATARKRRSRTAVVIAAAALTLSSAAVWLGVHELGHSDAEPAEGVAHAATATESAPSLPDNGDRFIGAAAIETQEREVVRFVTESGVELALGPASKARVRPNERRQSVELLRGTVSLEVPPLPPEASFSVVTPDATVTVHGTRFSVSYTAADGAVTCVQVREGKVTVARRDRATETLVAGQASGCESKPRRQDSKAHEKIVAGPRSTSTLAEENRLLQRALAAEQRGDDAIAVATARSLMARYPRSPFAEEARRVMARVDDRTERR